LDRDADARTEEMVGVTVGKQWCWMRLRLRVESNVKTLRKPLTYIKAKS
jgi:hypothetical protein